MTDVESMTNPTFITLGPEGTDHERATQAYIDFQGLTGQAQIELIDDLVGEGVERVHREPDSYLFQCSAHTDVHLVTERYPQEVVVADTFIYPTQDLSLLVRRDVEDPRTIALVKATRGYLRNDVSSWETVVPAQSKPVVSEMLLRGECDAGITFTELARQYPELFEIAEQYGEVTTTWVVYGQRQRYAGKVIGNYIPGYFTRQ